MDIEICRTCPHWHEKAAITDGEAMFFTSCDKGTFCVLIRTDKGQMERILVENGKKRQCDWKSRAYKDIAGFFKKEFGEMMAWVTGEEPTANCEMKMEHMISGWNNGH